MNAHPFGLVTPRFRSRLNRLARLRLSFVSGALGALAALLPTGASAAKFANQFVEFELPPQWQCTLESAEWVCQSQDEGKRRDAIIVLAAKLKGDQDSLDQYLTYLKATKNFTSAQGRPLKSEPKYAKTVSINGQPWVDALHLDSEIPGFYTRYLATVKEDIGVLVTYSINKAKYAAYLPQFETLAKTVRVFRKSGGINTAPASKNLFETQVPTNIAESAVFPGVNPQGGADSVAAPQPAQKSDDFTFYLILGAAAVLGIVIWRKRQSGQD